MAGRYGYSRGLDAALRYLAEYEVRVREEMMQEWDTYYKDFEREFVSIPMKVNKMVKRAENKTLREAEVALLRLRSVEQDEDEFRRKLVLREVQVRRTISGLFQFEAGNLRIGEKLKFYAWQEAKMREYISDCEEEEFGALQFKYQLTKGRPTIKVLTHCPFRRKVHCPFAHPYKMCHGMPLEDSHYEFSLVEVDEQYVL